MRYATLYYKIVCALDDASQLQASGSVLSTFKVGCVKSMMFDRIGILKTFQLNVVYQDIT